MAALYLLADRDWYLQAETLCIAGEGWKIDYIQISEYIFTQLISLIHS
jgi:hypothetical protein